MGLAKIITQPLTQETYQSYGSVIAARADVIPVSANRGTAERFNFLATLENKKSVKAKANLCVYRCQPQPLPFAVSLLERHPHSTQIFIPMGGPKRYLVIVCLGQDQPDVKTLKAFEASGRQGITYQPGIWHHPMVALEQATDFACLIWEDGSKQDCEVVKLDQPVLVVP